MIDTVPLGRTANTAVSWRRGLGFEGEGGDGGVAREGGGAELVYMWITRRPRRVAVACETF